MNDGVLVLVDADDDDCRVLKSELKSVVDAVSPLKAIVRIAIEEVEAFYLGDLRALKAAFPAADMNTARAYEPDSIVGTAELFSRIVGDQALRKVTWAEEMGARLTTNPSRSRSPSFKALHAGVEKLLTMTTRPVKARRKKHWKVRHPSHRKKKR